jgi:hypothetical protein
LIVIDGPMTADELLRGGAVFLPCGGCDDGTFVDEV